MSARWHQLDFNAQAQTTNMCVGADNTQPSGTDVALNADISLTACRYTRTRFLTSAMSINSATVWLPPWVAT